MIIDAHQYAFWHGRDAAGLMTDIENQKGEYWNE